jgi:hypothetical protein
MMTSFPLAVEEPFRAWFQVDGTAKDDSITLLLDEKYADKRPVSRSNSDPLRGEVNRTAGLANQLVDFLMGDDERR